MTDETFDELAARVDQLRDQVSHQEQATQELLRETLEAITEFNRRGLITLVQMLRENDAAAEVLYAAVDAPEVMALFVSHGIIRSDRTLDVLQVMEQIRPHLIASSIEMDVTEVRDDVAYVQFATGCSAPEQETKDEIMGVLRQRVPGLRDVVEVAAEPAGAFVALDSLRIGPPT
jgi:Fe-S cluster biogenesis protein NfuA